MRTPICILLLCSSILTIAQKKEKMNEDFTPQKNIIKANLPALAFRNLSFQYERVLSRRSSAVFSMSFIPEGKLPMFDLYKDELSANNRVQNLLEDVTLNTFAFSPEYRFYVGKGYGKGFYISPFYRYGKYKVSNLQLEYTNPVDSTKESISASGTITSNTLGLMIGSQFNMGKNLCLDWWIAGPNWGKSSGNIAGKTTIPLGPNAQNEIRQQLEDIDIPLTETEVYVDSNNAKLILDGPWAGFRAGLAIGYKF